MRPQKVIFDPHVRAVIRWSSCGANVRERNWCSYRHLPPVGDSFPLGSNGDVLPGERSDAFAMIEMRLVAATLLGGWRFEFVGEGLPRERPGFVMEAEGGIKMRLYSR